VVRRKPAPALRWRYLFVAAWAVLPVLATFIFSLAATPLFVNRYMIVSLPGMVLLAAAGVARLRRAWLQAIIIALVFYLSARSHHWWYTGYRKDDWRQATSFVEARGQAGDAVVFYTYTAKRGFDYYHGRAPEGTVPLATLELAPWHKQGRRAQRELDRVLLASLPQAHDRVWLVLWANKAVDRPDESIILDALRNHYTCVSEEAFHNIRILLFETTPQ
jgi:hypothetical protein